MKISEINLEVVQNYLRLPIGAGSEDEMELQMYLDAAKHYLVKYTGLTEDKIEENEYYSIPVLMLVAEFYENKSIKGSRYVNAIFDRFIDLDMVHHL
nr:head-tail connector protein [uncultured Lachnoclostridium sp.]